MDVSILQEPVDGMLNVTVNLYDQTDGKGNSIDVHVWVKESDSRSEIVKQAKAVALEQLKRAIRALESD